MSVSFAVSKESSYESSLIFRDAASIARYLQFKIAEIDELMNEQVNKILHHSRFQTLESSWRGLYFLVAGIENPKVTKIRLLDVSWKDLAKDIERSPDFDQSGLFHLVYNQEFGTPGGEPFSVLLGDYYVAHKPNSVDAVDDVYTLQGISRAAAAAFCPFVCGVSPLLLGLDSFDNIGLHTNIEEVFKSKEYIRWNALRDQEDARFLTLTLPQVLMRAPHQAEEIPFLGFIFNENVASNDNQNYLWGNSCFALGTILIREFTNVGWFSHIRGVPRDLIGGGLVTSFPSIPYGSSHNSGSKISTSVVITDPFETHLSDYGLMALCHGFQTPFSVFNNSPSLQRPKKYKEKSATANAKIGSSLQQILCGSRVAQYIKVIVRDMVGTYSTAASCERYLQSWLDQYTSGRDDLGWEMMARYPLREARVRIHEEVGSPGKYSSIIHLKTHYSADNLVSELRLTTSLSQIDIGRI